MLKILSLSCITLGVIAAVAGTENCNSLGILLYEDIGCKPVNKDGVECPIKYECDDFENKNQTCKFGGRSFAVGDHLDDNVTYAACHVNCYCGEGGEFTCAVLDCPEWLGNPIKPGCYRKYEVDKCCSVGQNCPSEDQSLEECEVDGEKITEGSQFYPKNTCMDCVCSKNFQGKYEAPHCQRRLCAVQIRDSDKLQKKCAPFYTQSEEKNTDTLCCPSGWVCPSSTEEVLTVDPKVTKNPELTCQFGNQTVQLGEGFENEVDFYSNKKRPSASAFYRRSSHAKKSKM